MLLPLVVYRNPSAWRGCSSSISQLVPKIDQTRNGRAGRSSEDSPEVLSNDGLTDVLGKMSINNELLERVNTCPGISWKLIMVQNSRVRPTA